MKNNIFVDTVWNKKSMSISGPFNLGPLYSLLDDSGLHKKRDLNDNKIIDYTYPSSNSKIISIEYDPKNYYAIITLLNGISGELLNKTGGLVKKIVKDMETKYPGWRKQINWEKDEFGYKFNYKLNKKTN